MSEYEAEKLIQQTVIQTLILVGKLPESTPRPELVENYGRRIVDEAIKSGDVSIRGKGKIMVNTAEFLAYFNKRHPEVMNKARTIIEVTKDKGRKTRKRKGMKIIANS